MEAVIQAKDETIKAQKQTIVTQEALIASLQEQLKGTQNVFATLPEIMKDLHMAQK